MTNIFGRDLHAEVAARHHDAVGRGQDLVELVEALVRVMVRVELGWGEGCVGVRVGEGQGLGLGLGLEKVSALDLLVLDLGDDLNILALRTEDLVGVRVGVRVRVGMRARIKA